MCELLGASCFGRDLPVIPFHDGRPCKQEVLRGRF